MPVDTLLSNARRSAVVEHRQRPRGDVSRLVIHIKISDCLVEDQFILSADGSIWQWEQNRLTLSKMTSAVAVQNERRAVLAAGADAVVRADRPVQAGSDAPD